MKRRGFFGLLGGMVAAPVVAKSVEPAKPLKRPQFGGSANTWGFELDAIYESGGTPNIVVFESQEALDDFARAAGITATFTDSQ